MHSIRGGLVAILVSSTVAVGLLPPTASEAPGNTDFLRTWQRTDWPVRERLANRSWIWGPEAFATELIESYGEAQGGEDSRYMLLSGGNAGVSVSDELWLLDFATTEWKTLPSTGGDAPAMSGHDAVWMGNGQLIVVGSGETWAATLT